MERGRKGTGIARATCAMRALQPATDPRRGPQKGVSGIGSGGIPAQEPAAPGPGSPALPRPGLPAGPGGDASGARVPQGRNPPRELHGSSRTGSRILVLALREGECGNSHGFAPELLSERVIRAFSDANEALERNACHFCRVEAGERGREAAVALCRALGPRAAWSSPPGAHHGTSRGYEIPVLLSARVSRAGGPSRACPVSSAALAPMGADSSCPPVDVLARLTPASVSAPEGVGKELFSLELRLKGPADLRAAERAAAERGVATWAVAPDGPSCPAACDFVAAYKARAGAREWRTARRILRRCGMGSRRAPPARAPLPAFAVAAELHWTRLEPSSDFSEAPSHRICRCVLLPPQPGLVTESRWHAVALRDPDGEEMTQMVLARALAAPPLAEAEEAGSRGETAQQRQATRALFPAGDAAAVDDRALVDAAARLERTYAAFAAYEGYSAWRGGQVPTLRLRSAGAQPLCSSLCLGPMAAAGVATESQRCLALSYLKRQLREVRPWASPPRRPPPGPIAPSHT